MFTDTLTRWMAGVTDPITRQNLQQCLEPLFNGMTSFPLSSAGLVIKAGASPLVKSGAAAAQVSASGKVFTIAPNTDMPALVGTVAQNTFNVFGFYQLANGNRVTIMGKAATTQAAVTFPAQPEGSAFLGYVMVNPTGGNFTGGTTALDDGVAVPNAAYVSLTSPFNPNLKIV